MTDEELKFATSFEGALSRYGNFGRTTLNVYAVAEKAVRDAGLMYEDPVHVSTRDNPVVNALVQIGNSNSQPITFSMMVCFWAAANYYFRKKAEEDARINTHEI